MAEKAWKPTLYRPGISPQPVHFVLSSSGWFNGGDPIHMIHMTPPPPFQALSREASLICWKHQLVGGRSYFLQIVVEQRGFPITDQWNAALALCLLEKLLFGGLLAGELRDKVWWDAPSVCWIKCHYSCLVLIRTQTLEPASTGSRWFQVAWICPESALFGSLR